MEIIQIIILGIIQGIAEFLPISSSGHLVLIPYFFGWQDQGLAFDVALHWGTLFAVIFYFRKDWSSIFKNSYLLKIIKNKILNNKKHPKFCSQNLKKDLLFIIIISTIPGVIVGLILNDYAENIFRNPLIVSIALFFGAILLFYSDKFGTKKTDLTNLTLKAGFIIGSFQILAIIPGVSRSGITITAALFLGMKRATAARFSFLLSTPIILGAGIIKFPDLLTEGFTFHLLIGIIISICSGYFAIKYMLKYLENKNYNLFVVYRILLAVFILFFLL